MAAKGEMSAELSLRTERLQLTEFEPDDAATIVRLAGARQIADTTISIPHPYRLEDAEAFIQAQVPRMEEGSAATFAIRLAAGRQLIGVVSLTKIDLEHQQAELGYWIGTDWWGKGYATEAARAVVRFGFDVIGLNRIYAHHMARNPASGRVLERVGMRREGVLRQRVRKWGRFEDVVVYAVLRDDVP
jgi:ribosomal-protein-alanine N-acetyltransferase